MRKFLAHSAYWALACGGAFALVTVLPVIVGWLASLVGAADSTPAICAVVALSVFCAAGASSSRSPQSDAAIRAHVAAAWRVMRAALRWRTLLAAALVFFVWLTWSDVDARPVLIMLFGLAVIAYLSGRESRDKCITDLHAALAEARQEVDLATSVNVALNEQLQAMTAALDVSTPADLMAERSAADPGIGMSRTDLLAASGAFASHTEGVTMYAAQPHGPNGPAVAMPLSHLYGGAFNQAEPRGAA